MSGSVLPLGPSALVPALEGDGRRMTVHTAQGRKQGEPWRPEGEAGAAQSSRLGSGKAFWILKDE